MCACSYMYLYVRVCKSVCSIYITVHACLVYNARYLQIKFVAQIVNYVGS